MSQQLHTVDLAHARGLLESTSASTSGNPPGAAYTSYSNTDEPAIARFYGSSSGDTLIAAVSGSKTHGGDGPQTLKNSQKRDVADSSAVDLRLQARGSLLVHSSPLASGKPTVRGKKTVYRMIAANRPWRYRSLASLFVLKKGEQQMTYSAVLSNSGALPELPGWLILDPKKGTLAGTPDAGTTDKLDLQIIATDKMGFSASTVLELQIYPRVLNIKNHQKIAVADNNLAINMGKQFSEVTATRGCHALLMTGSASSARILGSSGSKVTIAGSNNSVTLGDGNNNIRLVGGYAELLAGDGSNTVNAIGSFADITLGNGDNQIMNSADYARLRLGDGNNRVTSTGGYTDIVLGNGDNRIMNLADHVGLVLADVTTRLILPGIILISPWVMVTTGL